MGKDLILLVDDSQLSNLAKAFLDRKHVIYQEVNLEDFIGPIFPRYSLPTFFVKGEAYHGLTEIKRAVNWNLYL